MNDFRKGQQIAAQAASELIKRRASMGYPEQSAEVIESISRDFSQDTLEGCIDAIELLNSVVKYGRWGYGIVGNYLMLYFNW